MPNSFIFLCVQHIRGTLCQCRKEKVFVTVPKTGQLHASLQYYVLYCIDLETEEADSDTQ